MNNLLPWIAMSLACVVVALVGFYLQHREKEKAREEKEKRRASVNWLATIAHHGAAARTISTQEQIVGFQEDPPSSEFGRFKH